MGYFAIHLNYLEEQSKDVLSKDIADSLTPLLEKDFCKETGLTLGNGLEFFILALKAEMITEKTSRLEGDLIGPDSVGLDAEAQWEKDRDGSLKAWWSDLDVEYISQHYGKAKPVQLALPKLPFPVTYFPFWESHLPDLYLRLKLSTPSASLMKEKLDSYLKGNASAYFNVIVQSETSVDLHIALSGEQKEFYAFVEDLVLNMGKLHKQYPIDTLQFGMVE